MKLSGGLYLLSSQKLTSIANKLQAHPSARKKASLPTSRCGAVPAAVKSHVFAPMKVSFSTASRNLQLLQKNLAAKPASFSASSYVGTRCWYPGRYVARFQKKGGDRLNRGNVALCFESDRSPRCRRAFDPYSREPQDTSGARNPQAAQTVYLVLKLKIKYALALARDDSEFT